MFPAFPKTGDTEIDELKTQLLKYVGVLGTTLHPFVRDDLSTFMTRITSYYTNAMEGNKSKLKDIEEALNNNLGPIDSNKRQYQLEHLAHIKTQKEMLDRLDSESELDICSSEFLCWLHRRFYEQLPPVLHFSLTVSGKRRELVPGEIRNMGVQVGNHYAPETREEINRYLDDFRTAYSPSVLLSESKKLIAFAASHHRLLWIHPFPDGNGRVARLFTSAYAHKIGVGAYGLWNASRGFARSRDEYDRHLALADRPRRNDYDGRGPLSEEDLGEFCKFFFKCSIDQIEYMNGLLNTKELSSKFKRFISGLIYDKKLSKNAGLVLEKIMEVGEVKRGEVSSICDIQKRQSSNLIKEVLSTGFIQSAGAYAPLRISFNNELALSLFPGLGD